MKRLKKLKEILIKEKLAALIVVNQENNNKNVFYLSGFGGTTGALVVARTRAALAVDGRYTERAKKEVNGISIVSALSMPKDAVLSGYIRPALTALGIRKGARVGYEGMRVPVLMCHSWKRMLPVTLVPTKHIVERMRQVKDAYEIKQIATAARMTSRALGSVLPRIRAGMSERQFAFLIESALKKNGALAPSFETIVASGANAAIPHHQTSNRRMRAGESVVVDCGGLFPGGYSSDITRTVFVPGKKPHQKLLDAYRAVCGAHKKAFDVLAPGVLWKEYDRAARDYITHKGFGKYFTHGVGHSIGLDVHDPYDYAHDPFEEGNIITDEPGIYIPKLGGVRIEDDILITKTGAGKLSTAPYLSGTMLKKHHD